MTIANQTNRISALGAGVVLNIPYAFPTTASGDLKVIMREILTGDPTEFTEGAASEGYTATYSSRGGSVTTSDNIAATHQVHVIRNTDMTQLLDLEQGGSFNAENIEDALDKNTKLSIENSDALERTLVFPATDPISSLADMPNSIDRASKNLTFDSNGRPTASLVVEEGEVTFSDFGKSIAEIATASSARDTLGLGPTDYEATVGFADIKTKGPWLDIRAFLPLDFVVDGSVDYATELQAAIDAGNTDGKPVYWAPGIYKCTVPLTSGAGTHPIWIGAGAKNTQIYQATADTDLFQLNGVIDGFYISQMTLGTVAGTSGSVIKMTNAYRGTIEDIEIPGMGYRGISLLGCLLNTFKNVTASVNLPQPAWCNGTEEHAWIYLDDATAIKSNANTFVGCVIEGGEYGYYFDDAGSVGCTILGGVAEGHNTYAIYAKGIKGLHIVGLWTEASPGDGDSRIYLDECDGCNLDMAFCAGIDLVNCEIIRISGRCVGSITIDADCVLCEVDSLRIDTEIIQNCSDSSHVKKVVRSVTPKTYGTAGLLHTQHLISNGGNMDDWVGGLPVPFTNKGAATIAEEITIKKYGTSSAHVTKDSVNTWQGLEYDIPLAFKGQWITVEAWVYIVSGEMLFTFNQDAGSQSIPMTGTGKWIKHTASFFHNPTATASILFGGTYANDDDEFYVDGVKIWSEFNPYPEIIGDISYENEGVFYENETVTI